MSAAVIAAMHLSAAGLSIEAALAPAAYDVVHAALEGERCVILDGGTAGGRDPRWPELARRSVGLVRQAVAKERREGEVAVALLGCIPPDHVDGMLSHLRDFTDLPLGVHPNLGYLTSDGWHVDAGAGPTSSPAWPCAGATRAHS